MNAPDSAALPLALKQGEPAAFRRLVDEYTGRLGRFLAGMVGNAHEAEDLLQEVFLRVVRAAPRLDTTGSLKAWLFQIARNVAFDHLRRKKTAAKARLHHQREIETPDMVAEKNEMRDLVRRAVAELPEEQRAVFLLREESNLTFREIAQMLGCPLGTALARMRYAMENIRKSLKATITEKD